MLVQMQYIPKNTFESTLLTPTAYKSYYVFLSLS